MPEIEKNGLITGDEENYQNNDDPQSLEIQPESKPFENISKSEANRWAQNILHQTGIRPDKCKESILSEIYLSGTLDDILNPEKIKEMPYARNALKKFPDKEEEIIKENQVGLLTEEIARHDNSLEVNQKSEDYVSNLIMAVMQDIRLLPSTQYKSLKFSEKFANPDFIRTKEDKQGNIIVTTIGEIKTTFSGAKKNEIDQLSNFQTHLKQIIDLLNRGELLQLQENYGLPLLGPNKEIMIDPNLKMILYLPPDQINGNKIEDWEIKPLAFSTPELEKLLSLFKRSGLSPITREKHRLPLQYTEKEEVLNEFKNTLDNDLEIIKQLLGEKLDPTDYYSLLIYGKLLQNDEQRKLINDHGVKNYSEMEEKLSDFLNQHWQELPKMFNKHSGSRYAKSLYDHFKSPVALALIESHNANIEELENMLNSDEKQLFQDMTIKSLESLYQILRLHKNIKKGEDIESIKLKIRSFFYEQKKELTKSEQIEQIITDLEKTIDIMIERLNKSPEITDKFGLIDRTKILSIICFERLPESDYDKEIIEKIFTWQNFIELFKENLAKLNYYMKAHTISSKFEEKYYDFFPKNFKSSYHFLHFSRYLRTDEGKEILKPYSIDKEILDKMRFINFAHLLNIFFTKEDKS